MARYPVEKYASVELNQVAFPKTGMVVSQLPLGTEYTEAAPCENGMWVLADQELLSLRLQLIMFQLVLFILLKKSMT